MKLPWLEYRYRTSRFKGVSQALDDGRWKLSFRASQYVPMVPLAFLPGERRFCTALSILPRAPAPDRRVGLGLSTLSLPAGEAAVSPKPLTPRAISFPLQESKLRGTARTMLEDGTINVEPFRPHCPKQLWFSRLGHVPTKCQELCRFPPRRTPLEPHATSLLCYSCFSEP